MTIYNPDTEQMVLAYYASLSEKEQRHYASLEAHKLGYGGKRYIGKLLNVSQKTLRKGERELKQAELMAEIPAGKQRRAGGGRKKFCPDA